MIFEQGWGGGLVLLRARWALGVGFILAAIDAPWQKDWCKVPAFGHDLRHT